MNPQWLSILNPANVNQGQKDFANRQQSKKKQRSNERQKQTMKRATKAWCTTCYELQRVHGSIDCKLMQLNSVFFHYLAFMYPTRNNEAKFCLKYGFHDINRTRWYYLENEMTPQGPTENLLELKVSHFEQWKQNYGPNHSFRKQMKEKQEKFIEFRKSFRDLAKKLASQDPNFVITSKYWQLLKKTDSDDKYKNKNNLNTNENIDLSDSDIDSGNESITIESNPNELITTESNANESNENDPKDSSLIAIDIETSEFSSDNDVIIEMNQDKATQEKEIYDEPLLYEIDTTDKEYARLLIDSTQPKLELFFESKNSNETNNNSNHSNDMDLSFSQSDSDTIIANNDIESNFDELDNSVSENDRIKTIIDEFEAKMKQIDEKLDSLKSEQELKELECLCLEDLLLKLSCLFLANCWIAEWSLFGMVS